jgi:hypothetical protein
MLKKISWVVLIACCAMLYSCSPTTNEDEAAAEKSEPAAVSDNKHTTSLREAVDKLIKAEADKDTVTAASMLDSGYSITARGQTFQSRESFKSYLKTMVTEATSPVQFQNKYDIAEVEAGSAEPVWAGYERGTFTNTATSDDGSYNRKVSGPYYRAWKIVDGQWKCYHTVLMAFNCEGNDCK